MEFSFTLPTATSSGTPLQQSPASSFQTQGTGQGAFTLTATRTVAHPSHVQSLQPLGAQADDSYGRIAQTRAHGVGDTKQWRQRILSHIEDRVKDKRTSIQNSRRIGLNRPPPHEHHHHNVSSSTTSLDMQRASSQEEHLSAQSSHASITGSDDITPEEERRIVAEVWEAFKNENFAAFQALTDAEVEDIEGEIMRLKYDYDPTYDVMLDAEQDDMQAYDHYMLLERCSALERENAEMASALSLSITLLSGATCFRCQRGTFCFELATQGGTGTGSSITSGAQVMRAGCRACGQFLEDAMLVYIANAARNHSRTCSSQLLFDYDHDTGLLVMCSACDFMA